MGQKVNPNGLRLGINKTWDSKWFGTGKEYAENLHEDLAIRSDIMRTLKCAEESNNNRRRNSKEADIAKIEVIRYPGKVTINIHTASPGLVIGKKGSTIDKIEKNLKKITDKAIHVNIQEIKVPELDATVIAKNICSQIGRRRPHRRAMKFAIQKAMEAGAKGIKIMCSGRLGGAEMKRREQYKEGRIPLHTLRADIDYAGEEVVTTYGLIGVKVWLFKGEILEKNPIHDAGQTLIKKQNNKR